MDDGENFSDIGLVELNILAENHYLDPKMHHDPIKRDFNGYYHFKYVTGKKRSRNRHIFGSTVLPPKYKSYRVVKRDYDVRSLIDIM